MSGAHNHQSSVVIKSDCDERDLDRNEPEHSDRVALATSLAPFALTTDTTVAASSNATVSTIIGTDSSMLVTGYCDHSSQRSEMRQIVNNGSLLFSPALDLVESLQLPSSSITTPSSSSSSSNTSVTLVSSPLVPAVRGSLSHQSEHMRNPESDRDQGYADGSTHQISIAGTPTSLSSELLPLVHHSPPSNTTASQQAQTRQNAPATATATATATTQPAFLYQSTGVPAATPSTASAAVSIAFTYIDTIFIMLKAILVLIFRLWVASMVVYAVLIGIRNLPLLRSRFGPPIQTSHASTISTNSPQSQSMVNQAVGSPALSHSSSSSSSSLSQLPLQQSDPTISTSLSSQLLHREVTIQITRLNDNLHATSHSPIIAIPALFGHPLTQTLTAPICVIPPTINACQPLTLRDPLTLKNPIAPHNDDTTQVLILPQLNHTLKQSLINLQSNLRVHRDLPARRRALSLASLASPPLPLPPVSTRDRTVDSTHGVGDHLSAHSVQQRPHHRKKTVSSSQGSAQEINQDDAGSYSADDGGGDDDDSNNNSSRGEDEDEDDDEDEDISIQWIAVVPRGGCPFDEKVYHLQQAGFNTVIIHNIDTVAKSSVATHDNTKSAVDSSSSSGSAGKVRPISSHLIDVPVRMAAHSMQPMIHATSMFLRYMDVNQMIASQQEPARQQATTPTPSSSSSSSSSQSSSPIIVTLVPQEYGQLPGQGTFESLLLDMLLMLISVTLCGTCFLFICLVLSLLRNTYVYGRPYTLETILEGSQLILAVGPYGPLGSLAGNGNVAAGDWNMSGGLGAMPLRLKQVPFVRKVLQQDDIEILRKGGDVFHRCRSLSKTSPTGAGTAKNLRDDMEASTTRLPDLHDARSVATAATTTAVTESNPPGSSQEVPSLGVLEQGPQVGMTRDCCAICLDDFVAGVSVRELPCCHVFHDTCIDPWLLRHNRLCPICKRDVMNPCWTMHPESIATQAVEHQDDTQAASASYASGQTLGTTTTATTSNITLGSLVSSLYSMVATSLDVFATQCISICIGIIDQSVIAVMYLSHALMVVPVVISIPIIAAVSAVVQIGRPLFPTRGPVTDRHTEEHGEQRRRRSSGTTRVVEVDG
eukprot:jgi/Hompol1/1723/HPOL_004795-RA